MLLANGDYAFMGSLELSGKFLELQVANFTAKFYAKYCLVNKFSKNISYNFTNLIVMVICYKLLIIGDLKGMD